MSQLFHHLYLTGYRGSGKTSVGRWLGERLDLLVIDLDDSIEAEAGMSIRQIFEQEGELGFRNRESAALNAVSRESPSIVSLGGGAILREENRDIIRATGFCIWLKVDASTALQRLAQDESSTERRPSLTSLPAREEIISLLHQRDPLYSIAADAQIDVLGKSVATIGDEVLALLASGSLVKDQN